MLHPRAAPGVRGEDGSASHRGPSLRRPVPARVPASRSDAPARSCWVGPLCASTLGVLRAPQGAEGWDTRESGMSAVATACNSGHRRSRRGPNLLVPARNWVTLMLIEGTGSRLCRGQPLARAPKTRVLPNSGVALGIVASVSITACGSAG